MKVPGIFLILIMAVILLGDTCTAGEGRISISSTRLFASAWSDMD